jgi:hypothetical protein
VGDLSKGTLIKNKFEYNIKIMFLKIKIKPTMFKEVEIEFAWSFL